MLIAIPSLPRLWDDPTPFLERAAPRHLPADFRERVGFGLVVGPVGPQEQAQRIVDLLQERKPTPTFACSRRTSATSGVTLLASPAMASLNAPIFALLRHSSSRAWPGRPPIGSFSSSSTSP
jgi:hypothetical protein